MSSLKDFGCPVHPDPGRFYLKSGVKNPQTRGLTFFACDEAECRPLSSRVLLNNWPMYECDVHPGKPVDLQMFDKEINKNMENGQRTYCYRCTENMENDGAWCGTYILDNNKVPLKFYIESPVNNLKSPLMNDFSMDLGTNFFNPLISTSTPHGKVPKVAETCIDMSGVALLTKLENSASGFGLDETGSNLEESNVKDNQIIVADEDSSSGNYDPKNGYSKARSKKPVDDKSVLEDSISAFSSVQQSPSIQILDESSISMQTSSRAERCADENEAKDKFRHIRFNSSSSSSDDDNVTDQRKLTKHSAINNETNQSESSSILIGASIKKNIRSKLTGSNRESYISPFHKPPRRRVQLDDEEEDDDDEEEELGGPNVKLPQTTLDISHDSFRQKWQEKSDMNLESSDSSVMELPPLVDQKGSAQRNAVCVEDVTSKVQGMQVGRDESDNQSLREKLETSLKNLQAALPKSHVLPDKGARLKAKIAEVQLELQTLEKSDHKKSPVSQDVQDFRRQQLYAINDYERHRLYGGRMNDARRIEVKVITQEAVLTLHNALTQRPVETDGIDQPPGLLVELMPHQKYGVKWLQWRETQQPPGGILADDMGLGKTLTMIALSLCQRSASRENAKENQCNHFFGDKKLRPSEATLVVCPASVVFQWRGEIEKRVKPGFLNCLVYHGPKRNDISSAKLASYDFIITSYETVSSEVGSGDDDCKTKKKKPAGQSVLLSIAWDRIILDEGHRIKNYKTAISKACCRLPASNRWVLTGTPIHNKLVDFYSLLKFLRCEPFDEYNVWRKWIENKSEQAKKRLDTIIKGILLRRTKEEISSITGKPIIDLPPKKFEVHHVALSTLEKKVYDRIFLASKKQVADYLKQQEDKDGELIAISRGQATQRDFGYRNPFQPKKFDGENNVKNKEFYTRSHIFVLLLRLRQACSHFALMKEAIDVSAFDDLEESDDMTDNLMQQFTNMTILDGGSNEDQTDSRVGHLFDYNFINVLLQRLEDILKLQTQDYIEKVIIVSQWTKLLDVVEVHLKNRKIRYTSITGSTKPEDRNLRMEQFNKKNHGPIIMLLSLTAGGVGLNLVGANHLFLIDLHWNPALENQACDRIYRLGQDRNVFVHKFVCKSTIEEKVYEIQQQKLSLAQSVLDGLGGQNAKSLSLKDIKYLFEL